MNEDVAAFLLEHSGVKGMKWGRRKARGDRSEFKKPRKESTDFKKTVPLRNRKTHELSNKQIKTVNERINLEQNYSRLNPSQMQKGKIAVAGVLATATMAATAYNLVNSPAGKAAMATGKKMLEKKVKVT